MPVVTLFVAEGGRAVLVELSVMEQRYPARGPGWQKSERQLGLAVRC
jgi:hypothetical protein